MRRFALKFLYERYKSFIQAVVGSGFIMRHSHNTGIFDDRLQDTLTDPPNCIRNELKPLGFIEAPGSLHQADISFIDKVTERKALVLVLLGYRYNKPQVGFSQSLQGSMIARPDTGSQARFFLRSNHFNLTDIRQVFL